MAVDDETPSGSAPPEPMDPGRALASLLGPVRRSLALALAAAALGATAGVAGLVLVGAAVDELLGDGPGRERVAWLLAVALVLMVLRFVLRKVSFDISHHASFRLETVLRRDLARHLGTVPLGEVQRLGSGPLKKVVQDDVRSLHAAVADSVPMIGALAAQPVAALVALAVVDWRLLLAALAVVPFVAAGFRLVMRDYATQRRAYDRANEAVNAAVVEFVQGMPVVRTFDDGSTSFGRFAARVAEFGRATETWQRQGRSAGILTRLALTPLPTLVILLAAGTWLTVQGSMTPGALIVGVIIGTMPIETVVPLMYLSDMVTESRAAAARIREILSIPPLPVPAHPRPPAGGSLRFDRVTFGYDGPDGRRALDDVSFEVPAGSVCALVGASGSGKSTVARLIPRFWDVDGGSVELGGVDVRAIDPDRLLRHVGLVFQDPFLLDDTVAENIRLVRPDATDAEVEAAARAARADGFIRTELPDGYATRVYERGGALSGGQRQRLTIARALLADAPLVVLDEATAFADPESEAAIQDALAELTAGRTVVVIAHRLSTIVDADQIVVLDAGRVVEHGTHDDLVRAGGRYARLWDSHERARAWGMAPAGERRAEEVAR